MILIVKGNNKIICEEVRTAIVINDELIYYRSHHYPGEKHTVNLRQVNKVFIDSKQGVIMLWNKESEK